MSETRYPISGSCQCGNVSYQLLSPPEMVLACHCRQCQKLSTSAFSITALIKPESVVFDGELREWQRYGDNGNKNFAKFCPHCGNRIYHFNPDQPQILKLKPANLDDTSLIKPQLHIWVSEKQDWLTLPDNVPQCEGQPQL